MSWSCYRDGVNVHSVDGRLELLRLFGGFLIDEGAIPMDFVAKLPDEIAVALRICVVDALAFHGLFQSVRGQLALGAEPADGQSEGG